jgi:hypothetical protein
MNDRDSSFIKSYSQGCSITEQNAIEKSNNLLLLFSEIIGSCPDCLQKLRDSKKAISS